ncbi:nucleotidyl transferase AbiEii/AbiGii toxin family protein [Panacibacter sp. DH6]|uniref:Nucleotidyl transferase AbiEii/AbiGii toxin family protein n=1 Tax=Panacibacter microcysteis TaxID=2793269 RepID=A0A931H0H2_9BACT|nr:nucleotidyl transferase AbiEii/AbiGii toxin family protein [Panacibacter microcysteis]MBG9378764.1 nucleotidyl transferase AbiEii/AbiGii toxin family protein [Panacibacter microcysteis]
MIREWLEEYQPRNKEEAQQALREIMQEIALAGLQRSRFFEVAAFYGGTALRIFHGLDRFSEDLDFSLLEVNPDFSLQPYLNGMARELAALGMEVTITKKEKTKQSNVESAFLKPDTAWQEITLKGIVPQEKPDKLNAIIRIKLEVDKKPPLGFQTEEKLLVKPFSFYTKCYRLPDLFAGKMHALLFRKWANRVKGRDWYDMEWYVRKSIPLHLEHLAKRAKDSGNWSADTMSKEAFFQVLNDRISSVSMDQVKEDVVPFIKDYQKLDIWSPDYFRDLAKMIKFV